MEREMLTCTKCKKQKPGDSVFFPLHNKKKNGLDSWCRECRSSYKKDTRIPKGILESEKEKAYEIKEIKECVICGIVGDTVIDHDHKTGRVRGALCVNCNLGLGHFKDDPDLLELAAMYLRGECACGKCKVKWGGAPSLACH